VKSAGRARLLKRLRSEAHRAGTFTLASGKTSDFFIDCKQVVLSAEGHALVGELLLDAIEAYERAGGSERRIAVVAGVALGGCPLASAVALTSHLRGAPRNALYVRKEAKDHGTRSLVEGTAEPGANVALLEDVITTGGSTRAALSKLRGHGLAPRLVVVLVDRREGGAEALRAEGVDVVSLFSRKDFVR